MARDSFVYILASRRHGTLNVGSTTGLSSRLAQHRSMAVESFTRRYGVHVLVHVERYPTLREARARERQMKAWKRAWKVALIEHGNPAWRDLSAVISL
ncbi:MAG: GIY-YIG nuclease family protein [Gemmatimonadaceae bacterium]|nr:GIY-YIG nuclease family protein [Gemmatimonadaceae bacterium]